MTVIDRFENDTALLEDVDSRKITGISKSLLPENACEGDVVELHSGIYTVNTEATAARRQMIIEKMRKMGL
jgi:hypothetical protein